jgi:hypothetical protein
LPAGSVFLLIKFAEVRSTRKRQIKGIMKKYTGKELGSVKNIIVKRTVRDKERITLLFLILM